LLFYDAHDGESFGADAYRSPNHVRVRRELTPPQGFADQRDALFLALFPLCEAAPAQHGYIEHGQQPIRNHGGLNLFRGPFAQQWDLVNHLKRVGFDILKALGPLPIEIVRPGGGEVAERWMRRPKLHQPIRFVERKRPEEDGVDEAEDN